MTIARICACAWVIFTAAPVAAQPLILAMPRPDPNAAGWVNSPVRVEVICARAESCTATEVVATEGRDQEFTATAVDRDGERRAATVTFNIDYTPPAITLETPRGHSLTPASVIDVVAYLTDRLSGLATAACNGSPATIDRAGTVRCRVSLEPGVNDIVIDATDVAGNSASAGARVHRIGPPSSVTIVPDVAGVLVGSSRTFQLLTDYDLNAGPVTWSVEPASVGTMIGGLFQAHEQGTATITARFGEHSATATVQTYESDRLPQDAIRWKTGPMTVVQNFAAAITPTDKVVIRTAHDEPTQKTKVFALNEGSGALEWQSIAAMAPGEKANAVRIQPRGGAVTVAEGADGRVALVRTAGQSLGSPWRYQSSGTLLPDLVMDTLGNLVAVETANSFPTLLFIDGGSGLVRTREPLPIGMIVALNAACVPGAHAARNVAAQVGPLTVQADAIALPLVLTDDTEDFAQCGMVAARRERIVSIATVQPDAKRINGLRRYEAGADGAPPAIELFPVSTDGAGGWLVPWTAKFADGTHDSRVAHVTASGQQEIAVAAAGKIWLVGTDNMAAMTDGRTLVVFNILTGRAERTEVFPQGVQILGIQHQQLVLIIGKEQRTLSFQRPRG